MNQIYLNGVIQNIEPSHIINNIEYYKANLIVDRENSPESDIITLKFKKFSNHYHEGDVVKLAGNIRSHSSSCEGKNKVDIYVFTYLDSFNEDLSNMCLLDGRICKIDTLEKSKENKEYIRFILANNIFEANKKFNTYIPIVAFGEEAKLISQMQVGDFITVTGQLQSRTYRKFLENNTMEFRVAHEVLCLKINQGG